MEDPRSGPALFCRNFVRVGAAPSLGANIGRYYERILRKVSQIDKAIGYFPLSKSLPAGKVKILGVKTDEQAPWVASSEATPEEKASSLIIPLYLFRIDTPAPSRFEGRRERSLLLAGRSSGW